MNDEHLPEWFRKGIEPAVYAAGVFVTLVGALVSYTLVLTGKLSLPGAALAVTIVAAVGVILVIVGVMLRVHREKGDVVGALFFGSGLFVALIGSMTGYTLLLHQSISETGMLIGATLATFLAFSLVVAGVMWRVRYAERREVKRVVMKPLRRLYPRRVEEDQDGRDG